jgi:hypothetical protein
MRIGSLGFFLRSRSTTTFRRHRPAGLPPRGRPGDPEPDIPFEFVFLDPDKRAFPFLVDKAA